MVKQPQGGGLLGPLGGSNSVPVNKGAVSGVITPMKRGKTLVGFKSKRDLSIAVGHGRCRTENAGRRDAVMTSRGARQAGCQYCSSSGSSNTIRKRARCILIRCFATFSTKTITRQTFIDYFRHFLNYISVVQKYFFIKPFQNPSF